MNERFKQQLNYGLSILLILAGGFVMMFCFPFLWSANMADLVGAGFPFVSGAIMLGFGVLSFIITNQKS